ncbi:MAG: SUMF1/EgtB/PvdO family nonheme iron enzyme [Planctomycetes bacterium]|nr:SUMF1/EgtB/PvdO family nonheme iron enzyme [Planctomycetota bacterium]
MTDQRRTMTTVLFMLVGTMCGAQGLEASSSSESGGTRFVPIEPGTFTMGADLSADTITAEKAIFIQDELPARQVTLTYGFEMSKYEVTNAQYEQFDRDHAALRGKAWGLSAGDNEAVGYVSGSSKVVRGGCHNVHIQTLRSANRSSSNRTDRHLLLGLRVVRVPRGQALPKPTLKHPVMPWARHVSRTSYVWPSDQLGPHFELTSLYDVKNEYGSASMAEQLKIPIYNHNHSPALTSFSDGSAEGGSGASANCSSDGGASWAVRTIKDGPPGIHVGGVELTDGRIMTFTRDRGQTFDGKMPQSVSTDQGRTFTSRASEFPPLSTVMCPAVIRLAHSSTSFDPNCGTHIALLQQTRDIFLKLNGHYHVDVDSDWCDMLDGVSKVSDDRHGQGHHAGQAIVRGPQRAAESSGARNSRDIASRAGTRTGGRTQATARARA